MPTLTATWLSRTFPNSRFVGYEISEEAIARARAFATSTSRFLGGALVSSEPSSLLEAAAISSTAA